MTVEANPNPRATQAAAGARRPLQGLRPAGHYSSTATLIATGRVVSGRDARHLSDLGGYASASEAEHSLVKRVATFTVELERLEGKFSATDDPSSDSLDLYQRMTNTLRRLLETPCRWPQPAAA